MTREKYYAWDLDGSIAKIDPTKKFDPAVIGEPIAKAITMLKKQQDAGHKILIFTARASSEKNIGYIKDWLAAHDIKNCKITNKKLPSIEKFFDDRAVGLVRNKGIVKNSADALTPEPKLKTYEDLVPYLKPHQLRAVDRITDPNTKGVILQHNVGSGKTLSSLSALAKMNLPTVVITPAALQTNYKNELKHWLGRIPDNVTFASQQQVARNGLAGLDRDVLILDESQKMRNEAKLLNALRASKAKKRILLSGTTTINSPRDLSPLVNFVAGKNVLPEDMAQFKEKYIEEKPVNPTIWQRLLGAKPGIKPTLKNTTQLRHILNKYVDYYSAPQTDYPTVKEEKIDVPMGARQTDIYNSIMKRVPWLTRQRVKWNLPPGKGDLDKLKSFLTGPRQVANSSSTFVKNQRLAESPKIDAAFRYFMGQLKKNPKYHKGVAYSPYLNSGLAQYKKLLERANVPYGEFSGDISKKQRDEMVRDFNENKLRMMFLSPSGEEGLTLKGVKNLQILSPQWNAAREQQIVGRSVRFKSHSHLPPDQRNVLVQRYFAQPRGSWLDRLLGKQTVQGVDNYIYNTSLQKQQLNDQMLALMKQSK